MGDLDTGTISALLIGAASLVGWLVTQTQARSRAQRSELRWRRKRGLLQDRYIYRLEQGYAELDRPLPEKPEGLENEEGDEW